MKWITKPTIFITLAFGITLLGTYSAWNHGYKTGISESKSTIEKSLELYNLGEIKYIELARETANDKEARPEFVEKM